MYLPPPPPRCTSVDTRLRLGIGLGGFESKSKLLVGLTITNVLLLYIMYIFRAVGMIISCKNT